MRSDLRALEMLLAVAEQGSIGSAARELGVSQPAVSARIRDLERRTRLDLVERTPRGSRLTTVGATLADWARDVLVASDRLEAGVRALRATRNSELRLSASMTIAEYLLPRWLTELAHRSPSTTVALRVRNSRDVAADVMSGAADLGFVEGVGVPAQLRRHQVARDELVVVVGRRHPWARRRRPLPVTELATAALVLREPGSGTREALERTLARTGVDVAPRLVLASSAAIKSAVESGEGVTVLSRLVVADELHTGRLVAIDVEGLDMRRSLRAVWPSGVRLSEPATELLRCAGASGRNQGRHQG
ncbi:MAG: LysR family transcriptional regulator [Streptosporangiales bacterium]|nr:LysR family transcriptional regulator [Streptosporangiales bacterium]